jgi:hypothetical protein
MRPSLTVLLAFSRLLPPPSLECQNRRAAMTYALMRYRNALAETAFRCLFADQTVFGVQQPLNVFRDDVDL